MGLVVDSYRFAAAAGFDPTDISGLTLWLDASDSTTIADTSGSVDTWTDKSSNALALDATAGLRPTTGVTTLNSLNVLDFSGSNRLLTSGAHTILDATNASFTGIAVVRSTATGTQGIVTQDQGLGSFRLPQIIRLNTYIVQTVRVSDTNGISVVLDAEVVGLGASTWGIASSRMSATTLEAFANGVGNGSSAVSSSYAGSHNVIVGQSTAGGEFFTGSIAEVIVYNTALSTSDREDVEDYLTTKWGI